MGSGAEVLGRSVPGLVDRIVALLDCVATAGEARTLSQISRGTGLPLSTTHRLLAELVDGGMIARSGRLYAPGPKMRWASGPAVGRFGPQTRRHLADHVTRTGLPVALAVLDGRQVRHVHVSGPLPHPAAAAYRTVRVDARTSAAGRLLLACGGRPGPAAGPGAGAPATLREELHRIRQEGIAIASGESLPGIVEIAAPVRDPAGRVMAAVSTAGQLGRVRLAVAVRQTLRTADRLSVAP